MFKAFDPFPNGGVHAQGRASDHGMPMGDSCHITLQGVDQQHLSFELQEVQDVLHRCANSSAAKWVFLGVTLFWGIYNVLLWFLVIWTFLNIFQPGDKLSPLSNIFNSPKSKWPPSKYYFPHNFAKNGHRGLIFVAYPRNLLQLS